MTSIRIIAPDWVAAGSTLSAVVELDCGDNAISHVEIGVHAHLVGTSHFASNRVVHHGDMLEAGAHTFAASFEIPDETPPSHRTATSLAHLYLVANAYRDSGQGATSTTMGVRVRRLVSEPVVREMADASASGRHAFEIAIASRRLTIGEPIIGTLVNRSQRWTTFQLQLVSKQSDGDGFGSPEIYRAMPVVATAEMAELPIPFAFQIPDDVTPSFATQLHRHAWELRVVSTGSQVSIPLELVDRAPDAEVQPVATHTREIGDRSVATRFTRFAADAGWQEIELVRDADLGVLRPAIQRHVSGSVLGLAHAVSLAEGPSVVALAELPSLGLGLRVTRRAPLLEMFTRDIAAGHPVWDRHHHVVARDDEQTAPLLRAVVSVLVAMEHLGEIARWTDRGIAFARRHDGSELAEMADELHRVVEAIVAAASAITPPAIPGFDVASWRQLAASLGGVVQPGDLAIDGATFHDLPAHVAVHWGRRLPTEIAVHVGTASASRAFDATTAVDDVGDVLEELARELAAKGPYR